MTTGDFRADTFNAGFRHPAEREQVRQKIRRQQGLSEVEEGHPNVLPQVLKDHFNRSVLSQSF